MSAWICALIGHNEVTIRFREGGFLDGGALYAVKQCRRCLETREERIPG